MARIAFIVSLLLVSTPLHAQVPLPVRPTVDSAYVHMQPSVRLVPDSCFRWTRSAWPPPRNSPP